MAAATYQLDLTGEKSLEHAKAILGDDEALGQSKSLGHIQEINGVAYHILRNKEAGEGYFNHFISSLDKDKGWRVFKTGESVAKLLTEVGVTLPEGGNKVVSRAGDYWKFASVANVLPTSREALRACGKVWSKEDPYIPGEEDHRVAKAFQKSLGAVAMWGYAISAIAGCFSGLGMVVSRWALETADAFDFGDKSIQLGFNHQTYNRATEAAEKAQTGEVKKCFTETANLAMIRIAQAICSIVGFFFGLMLILGSSFIPPIVALTLSVAGNLLAIWATIYAKSMEYGEIKFFDHKHILSVATA